MFSFVIGGGGPAHHALRRPAYSCGVVAIALAVTTALYLGLAIATISALKCRPPPTVPLAYC
jgi:hypothetical protein